MTDIFGYMIQGLFVGIGSAAATWFAERHMRKKLDIISRTISTIKNGGKKDEAVSGKENT